MFRPYVTLFIIRLRPVHNTQNLQNTEYWDQSCTFTKSKEIQMKHNDLALKEKLEKELKQVDQVLSEVKKGILKSEYVPSDFEIVFKGDFDRKHTKAHSIKKKN